MSALLDLGERGPGDNRAVIEAGLPSKPGGTAVGGGRWGRAVEGCIDLFRAVVKRLAVRIGGLSIPLAQDYPLGYRLAIFRCCRRWNRKHPLP